MERRSVMASTADIQVSASRGRTTQELHSEALPERERESMDKRVGKEKEGEEEERVEGCFNLIADQTIFRNSSSVPTPSITHKS